MTNTPAAACTDRCKNANCIKRLTPFSSPEEAPRTTTLTALTEQLLTAQKRFAATATFAAGEEDTVSLVDTLEDMTRYLALRAARFVGTGQRAYANMAPTPAHFVEPCDFHAMHSWVRREGAVRYAIRMQDALTALRNDNYVDFHPLLAAHAVPGDIMMTRFFTPESDGTSLRDVYALFRANYAAVLRSGGQTSWLTCASAHLKFFTKIGFARVGTYTCRHSGEQHLMRLGLRDRAHLAAMRSPLLPVHDRILLS